uniref:Large ribosomal subunit protein uL11m n=1 Tax=Phallusia mammillata TaxID=59560 RepID=A0A6F9DKH9_9ASCI|nr:39S ribosomal protein L11, mitochondrial-like [Phallusia mammillata]
MSSKLTKATKQVRKVFHPNIIKAVIPSGGASNAPPLGTKLSQYGIPAAKFVQEFNNLTKDYKEGIPTPVRIHMDGKRFRIELREPPQAYLIKQAAGIEKASKNTDKIAGIITHKHVYEIAKIKLQQENVKIRSIDLKTMCESVAKQAWQMGVKVQRTLDAEDYKVFLDERQAEREELKRLKRLEMEAAAEEQKKKAKKLNA